MEADYYVRPAGDSFNPLSPLKSTCRPAIPSTPSLKKSPAPFPRISPARGAYPFTDGPAAHQGRAKRGTGMRIFRGLFAVFAALTLTFVILERLPAPVQRADAPWPR